VTHHAATVLCWSISATAVSPGYVDTDMTAWKRDEPDQAAILTTGDIAELVLAIARLSRGGTQCRRVPRRRPTVAGIALAIPSL
jgi:NAD(P)-dependent dehydrogenase (short-subunit alcohol dehydrogenase family)